ncbi:MAG: hypothetical protein FWC41_10115, partial [Firmicutes bacterium]|nr:hypothetical protein [Bacillota bacterium]
MKPTLLKLATFLLMVAVAFAFASCEKPVEPTKPKPPQPKYPIDVPFTEYSLDGTNCEWQNLPYDDKV